jgi:hypothetical protein
MSILDRYQAYADAFEVSYEDDDWSRIEPFLPKMPCTKEIQRTPEGAMRFSRN